MITNWRAPALKNSTTGSNNVALGYSAGSLLSEGSNNVYVANSGEGDESGVIRIGTPNTQTATYIAGIENSKVTGSVVYVTSKGQLGVLASSERYKTAIAPMAATTEKLRQLHPVTFHLKTDPQGTVQYGLIAEEVAKVYPELAIRDESGKIEGVRYDERAPMLLNEVQMQQRELEAQSAEIRGLKKQQERVATQAEQLRDLQFQISELKETVAASSQQKADPRVALRLSNRCRRWPRPRCPAVARHGHDQRSHRARRSHER
jgi:hypothetical protein